jgi:hypothetical protein
MPLSMVLSGWKIFNNREQGAWGMEQGAEYSMYSNCGEDSSWKFEAERKV